MSAAKKMYWAAWMARFVGHLYQDLRKRTLKTCTCVSHMCKDQNPMSMQHNP